MVSGAHRLPVAMRAWSVLGRNANPNVQLRVANRLARRLLVPGRAYASAGDFVVEIDREDPFQPAMALGLFGRLTEGVLRRYAQPGATVIDAGAHLGYFTMEMARCVGAAGQVHAFEPDPRIYPRLRCHVDANGLSWVVANQCGLLDREVEAQDLALPAQLGWASVIPGFGNATEVTRVRMVTLDQYLRDENVDPGRITLIKIDVEGAELEALHGATETLSAAPAAVLVEHIPDRMLRFGQNPTELLTLMGDHGYEPWVPALKSGKLALNPGSDPTGEDLLFLKRN